MQSVPPLGGRHRYLSTDITILQEHLLTDSYYFFKGFFESDWTLVHLQEQLLQRKFFFAKCEQNVKIYVIFDDTYAEYKTTESTGKTENTSTSPKEDVSSKTEPLSP